MPSAAKILEQLPPYRATETILVYDQDTEDIIQWMMAYHDKFAEQYDAICMDFDNPKDVPILNNIYWFLKNNVNYHVESDSAQFVKSPAAILETGRRQGSDCKNYALFTAGVLDALNRRGYGIPFCYRFASYGKSSQPEHVFIVAWPETNHEYWVDPVPPIKFPNDRSKLPTYWQDIIFSPAPPAGIGGLMGLAGAIPSYGGAVLTTLPTMLTDLAGGNYYGALLQLGNALVNSSGHSNWWYADQSLLSACWPCLAQAYLQFFAQPGFNSNGKGGFQGDLSGMVNTSIVPTAKGGGTVRYLLLPAIFQNTFSGNICIIIEAAVNENLLPASALPAATTVAAVNAAAVEPDTLAQGNALAVPNFDKFVAAGNWAGMSQQACKLYFDPFANSTGMIKTAIAGFGGQLVQPVNPVNCPPSIYSGTRVALLPQIYANTGDIAILAIIQDAIFQGVLPATALDNLPAPAATGTPATAATGTGAAGAVFGLTTTELLLAAAGLWFFIKEK